MAESILLPEHEAEGYRTEESGAYLLVWHHNTQIALLMRRDGVIDRARGVVERRRQELRDVTERTGWTPN